MKHLLILILFLPIILKGQDTSSIKQKRIFLNVNLSPDYCYRYITKNDNSITNEKWEEVKNLLDSLYKPIFGYSTGLNVYYQIGKRFSLETGFQFSRKGYKTIPILTIYDFKYDAEIATNYTYFTYFDFPLRANFSFGKNKLQFITSAGVLFNYLYQVRDKTIPETSTEKFQAQAHVSKYPYTKTNISPTISLGLKYNINKRMNLRVEPTFRYSLFNIDSKSFAYTKLWTAGFNISFSYGL